MVHLASFWKPAIGGQTVLPDKSMLIRQKLVVATFWDFQTMRVFLKPEMLPQVNFNWTKIGGKCQNWKTQILGDF